MNCTAECHISDDHGDGHATMRCQLAVDHDGPHKEKWRDGRCTLTWTGDDKDENDTARRAAEALEAIDKAEKKEDAATADIEKDAAK